MTKIHVFDCSTFVESFDTFVDKSIAYQPSCDAYQTAIYYVSWGAKSNQNRPFISGWYKMDDTPMLISDVPKEYLTLQLMLDL